MEQYRLREPMVGVSHDSDRNVKIVTLPVDAVLTVATITLQSGLVDGQWEDQTIAVFVQDLKTRGELILAHA